MRSADDADLTARARIRDTAIRRWGTDGFGASVRGIAADAGVSPALLLHHWGSKDGLRQACDEYVLDRFARETDRMTAQELATASAWAILDRDPEFAPLAAYVRRAVTDERSAGRFWTALVDDTRRWLQQATAAGRVLPTRDEETRAELLVVLSLGAQLLAHHLAPPGTPADRLLAAVSERVTGPALELFTHGLFTDDRLLQAYLDHRPGEEPRP
ncbi:TetR family transcriptional regulator [Nakamurella endophytica]|uniref:TetR family transcriptional regulator n=1 Tax=Nakamurella endophytica TaxID=1748367 RepID=A0A917SM77_9ACTN|nr:TetR family transcriptional regulator [Nakamurella endophytica]GGL87306.1 TetR family transcriptional regulator [Nakamurella endophytica]